MNVMRMGGGGGQQDRTTFVGVIVPRSIKRLPGVIEKIGLSIYKKIFAVVVATLEGTELADDCLSSLATEDVTEEVISNAFAGINDLVVAALKHPPGTFKKNIFTEDLLHLGLANEHAVPIVNIIYGSKRETLEQNAIDAAIRLPSLKNFKWRVDVSISTSDLKRAMKPSVLMQMTLSDGKIHTFEMPVEQFHKLRYNTAFVLKEMDDLMKRPVMQAP